ncbi:MAG: lysylphosphatidylglycerol synthase transmembrane domain-containing protein [Burkholderiales bacterium]
MHVRWLRPLLRPRFIFPAIATAALLLFAFSVAGLSEVMASIHHLTPAAIARSLGLAVAYLLIKGTTWRFLLTRLGIRIPWRRLALAFLIGESCIPIPSGVYIENYVLRRIGGAGFATSAAATTVMLALEAMVVFLTLVVFPVPALVWLRPIILATGFVIAALWAILTHVRLRRDPQQHSIRHSAIGVLRQAAGDLFDGLRVLATPRILVACGAAAAVYLLVVVVSFLNIAHGVGATELTLMQALTIYFFSLAAMFLFSGVVSQFGVVEVVGMTAAEAWGYSPSAGLAMLLGFRLVWMLSIWLIAILAAIALHRNFRRSTADDIQKIPD